jgi:thiamine pyrophosphate-dependent acetolactate synthase large subunit-like protein
VNFSNPDLAQVAAAFGVDGKVCSTVPEIEKAIGDALASRRLTLIQAIVDPAPYRL